MYAPPPPPVIEISVHFDSFGALHYARRGANARPEDADANGSGSDLATVDPDGTIDLTRIATPVVLVFHADPADHHPFDRRGPLFTSDAPFIHTHRWRPDEQFRRVRLMDHGYTLRIDYRNINHKHGRPMPANGYDLSFLPDGRHDKDPAIKNGSVTS
jgi:hypothetical protein